MQDRIKINGLLGSIFGLITGDALGVPVEFISRDRLQKKPIADMVGYGTHNQPPGTWSDDSTMTLITMEALLKGYPLKNIMVGFCDWLQKCYWTPYGQVFDIGNTTRDAILQYNPDGNKEPVGFDDEYSNGNGSLMRILPLSLYVLGKPKSEIVSKSFEVSKLTHAHIRSCLCCGYFSLLINGLYSGKSLSESMQYASDNISSYIPEDELNDFDRILSGKIVKLPMKKLSSSGYVISTLEAALWCCYNTGCYKEAVLKAVNLGNDTDTVGAVTGAIAGLMYGYESIPKDWIKKLALVDDIRDLSDSFITLILKDE